MIFRKNKKLSLVTNSYNSNFSSAGLAIFTYICLTKEK